MPAKLRLHAAPATFVSLALVLALGVVGVVVLGGGRAAAVQQLSCGDTITADTILHKDLLNCANNGIIIGADNITLDLNYHTISGDGTAASGCDPEQEFCDVGVLNRGHDGVTVVHGSVHEFVVGVWGLNASHNSLLGISSSGNEGAGLGFFRGTRSLVRNCSGNGSIRRDGGLGMFLIASHHVRVLDNSFRNNGDLGIFVGIEGLESTHNLIKGNRLLGNTAAGVVMEGANRNRLRGNRVLRNGEGIFAAGDGNVIARNRVFGALGGSGITFGGGHDNLIAHNVVVRAGRDTANPTRRASGSA